MLFDLSRPMLTAGLPFIIACFVASFLEETQISVMIALLIITLAIYLLSVKDKRKLGIIIALTSAIFATTFYGYKQSVEYLPIRSLENTTEKLSGTVIDIDEVGSYCYTLKVNKHDIEGIPVEFTLNLYSPVPMEVDFFDEIEVTVKFFAIEGSPGFDTAKYYKQNERYIFGYAPNSPVLITPPERKPIAYYFKQLNRMLCDITDQYMQGQPAAIVKAMVLGNDEDVLKITDRNLANAGVIHVTAISGLHVLIASVFFLLLCKAVRINPQIASILSILVVWCFVALTDFHYSTVRAGIMITIPVIGNILGRSSDGINSLFTAGLFIAIQNPFAVTDVGFMMTFLATLSIILFQGKLQALFITRNGIKNWLGTQILKMFAITLSANLLLIPVMILVFKGISIIAPIANLIATPITPVILLLSFIMLVLGTFPSMAPFTQAAAELNTFAVDIMLKNSEFFSKFPFAYLGLNFPYVRIWLIISLAVIAVVIILKKSLFAKSVIACLLALVICTTADAMIFKNSTEIITVNTSDGRAVVLIDGISTTVVAIKNDDYLGYEIARVLETKNIRRIETLIILEDETMEIEPLKYLDQICPIAKILLKPTNKLTKYVNESLSGLIGIYDITVNYQSKTINGTTTYVRNINGETAVFFVNKGMILCITDSVEIAKETNCEFLYFTEKSCEQVEHFKANYVILLDDCETDNHSGKRNVFFAYKYVMSLNIANDGKFTLRRSGG